MARTPTIERRFVGFRSAESTGMIEGKQVDMPARCPDCGKLLMGYAARPWQTVCRNCRKEVRRH